ncbi:MAG: CoA-binding protein [Hydrogenophilales bacterium]|jgi:predicted CoA-binding protein|tara:strand:- start:1237 stop:1704 length:468 start_codon:yes stop_codon:yes gene_type:complete
MYDGNDIETIKSILKENKSIAVVGLSANWNRPSFFASKYMQQKGYKIIPVNPRYSEILGEKCYKSLLDIEEKVDIVDCFRRSDDILPIATDAIKIKAKVLWMQLSVFNEDAANLSRNAGLKVVQDRCVKIEHARLFGGLNWVGVNTKIISAKKIN